ncbi:hypothetical protein [Muricoccus radiodurans]|uniref:hypothetical protein n=1 Tax=Muricoccus radiodurans TaxID=2231721 RepID=UPI003CF87465
MTQTQHSTLPTPPRAKSQTAPPSGGRGAASALRGLLDRAFPRPPRPARESDIERALLRALGAL